MIWPFKCSHPAEWLAVEKGQTVERAHVDYDNVTYHLKCMKCGAPVKVEHIDLVGGVHGFLSRVDTE